MRWFVFRWRLVVLGFALTLLLGGCAQQPIHLDQAASIQNQHNSIWQAHQAAVRQAGDWQCIGRIAIRTDSEGGTVNFNWQQIAHQAHIILNAPLNQGTVELIGSPDDMLIIDSTGHRQRTSHPESSIKELTGWNIPIKALPDWIRGLPHDPSALIRLNSKGWLHTMKDDGWVIKYESYRPVPGYAVNMPRKISVSRSGVHLRLVVESWQMKQVQAGRDQ